MQRLYTRRALTAKDFANLPDAAWNSTETVSRLSGQDRWHLYSLASNTGWRASEFASLIPDSFTFDDTPTVMLDCTISKRRRYDVAYLDAELGEVLKEYLKGKLNSELIWPDRGPTTRPGCCGLTLKPPKSSR